MTVRQSIAFLRDQGNSLFSDGRFQECAYNLECAYETISRIRSVAGVLWKELGEKYNSKPNDECRVALNALSDIANMTGWATNWENT